MGKLVTFWSPVAGQARVTSSMIAIVSYLSLSNVTYEIAVSSVEKEDTTLEDGLEERRKWKKSEALYEKSGVSALLLGCKQGVLTKERIRRSALPLLLPKVSLFPGLKKEVSAIHGRETEKLEYYILTEGLKGEYGLTFLDLRSGVREMTSHYMSASDLIVVVLPQTPAVWKRLFLEYKEQLREKRLYILFGGYMKNSKYGMMQYKRWFANSTGSGVGAVPLCEGYMDALADGKAVDFFLKNEYARKRDENYEFMESVKRAAKGISDSILLP